MTRKLAGYEVYMSFPVLDIDECTVGNAAGKAVCTSNGELCQNVRGGYRCNKINCPPGYIIDAQRKK